MAEAVVGTASQGILLLLQMLLQTQVQDVQDRTHYLYFLIEVKLIYNVVLISDV